MKNYEKYKDKIYSHNGEHFCHDFVRPIILEVDECNGRCTRCNLIQAMWLMSEYTEPEEPEVGWSKVEVDTPILVRNTDNEEWNKRYFARYENGTIYARISGRTSWTAYDSDDVYAWKYAKLAETRGAE